MRSAYLVCYDITDPSRLARVLRLMKGEGVHLEYSVFLCSLSWPELQALKERLAGLIEAASDDVRIYPLPSGPAIEALGLEDRVPEGVSLHLPREARAAPDVAGAEPVGAA